jgi:oligoendopeptidase F
MAKLHRSELTEAFKWDLEKIFRTEQDWEDGSLLHDTLLRYIFVFAEFTNSKGLTLANYRGRLSTSASVLAEALIQNNKIDRTIEKLFTYANLCADQDLGDSKASTRLGRSIFFY